MYEREVSRTDKCKISIMIRGYVHRAIPEMLNYDVK